MGPLVTPTPTQLRHKRAVPMLHSRWATPLEALGRRRRTRLPYALHPHVPLICDLLHWCVGAGRRGGGGGGGGGGGVGFDAEERRLAARRRNAGAHRRATPDSGEKPRGECEGRAAAGGGSGAGGHLRLPAPWAAGCFEHAPAVRKTADVPPLPREAHSRGNGQAWLSVVVVVVVVVVLLLLSRPPGQEW